MRKLLLILFVFISVVSVSQDFRSIDWKSGVDNVELIGVSDTFKFEFSIKDWNDVGVGQIGDYFVDFIDRAFKIIDSDATTITVVDLSGENTAPQSNQIGRVYQSVLNGDERFGSIGGVDVSVLDELSRWRGVARNNELFARAIDSVSKIALTSPVSYLDFDTTLTSVERKRARLYYDKERDNLVFYDANKDVSLDIGKEMWVDVYNPSTDTIFNGKCIVFQGNGGSHPSVKLAQANLPMNISSRIGLATQDIAPYTYGRMTIVGEVRDYDTRGMTTGQKLFISSTTEGDLTTSRPEFPNYRILVATVDSVGEFGSVNVNVIGTPSDITGNITNGAFNEDFDFKITSDGTTVTGTLTDDEGNGYLTTKFSDGLDTINLPASISIPQGTSTNPQFSYVYLEKSTKKLAVSTSYWSELEHIPIATIVIRTAAQVQVAGAIRNQNVNNHLASSNGMGGLDHIRKRIRILYCVYESGCDITVNADDFTTTSGSAWQMHLQSFDAHSLSLDGAYVVNDFTSPYTVVNSLSEMLEDASGDNLKNKEYSIVVWGVQNSTDAPDQLMINLPTSTYNSVTDAINDADGYTNYSIPRNFRGVGVLFYRLTFSNSNGVWSIEDTEDLRGTIPSNVAGGGTGGAGGIESFLQLLDSPSSYVGAGGNFVTVSSSETDLEFTPKSSVQLTELDSSGFELTASQITDFDSEVSNNTAVVANTAKTSANNATITFQGSAVSGTPETITLNQSANKTITINDTQASAQTLSKSGTDITLSDGGGTVSIADNDNSSTNEIQDISGISTNAIDIDDLEAEQLVQNNAISLNTVKRSYPIGDENKLDGIESGAEVNTINSGDNVSLLNNDVPYLVNSDVSGFVPYSGATQDLDLGSNDLSAAGAISTGTTTLSQYQLDLPRSNAWSYIQNSAASGGLKIRTRNSSGTITDAMSITNGGQYVQVHTTNFNAVNGNFSGDVTAVGGEFSGLTTVNNKLYVNTLSGNNRGIFMNRPNVSSEASTQYLTANSPRWIVGMDNNGEDDFAFYNYGIGGNNLMFDYNTGEATFSKDVRIVGNTTISGDLTAAELQINGTNINTAGTLNNVAYLNQANTFTKNQTIETDGSAYLKLKDDAYSRYLRFQYNSSSHLFELISTDGSNSTWLAADDYGFYIDKGNTYSGNYIPSGMGGLYNKGDGKVYFKEYGGTEYDLTAGAGSGSGTVTSVAISSNDLTTSGTNPITTSGTINLEIKAGAVGATELSSYSVTSTKLNKSVIADLNLSTSIYSDDELMRSYEFGGVDNLNKITIGNLQTYMQNNLNFSGSSGLTSVGITGPDFTITDSPLTANGNISMAIASGVVGTTELASTTVSAGSYSSANITVDSDGRITAASDGSGTGSSILTTKADVANNVTQWLNTGGSAITSTNNVIVTNATMTILDVDDNYVGMIKWVGVGSYSNGTTEFHYDVIVNDIPSGVTITPALSSDYVGVRINNSYGETLYQTIKYYY